MYFNNEQVTFPIPYFGDESDSDEATQCDSDFEVYIDTDEIPEEITWEWIDDN